MKLAEDFSGMKLKKKKKRTKLLVANWTGLGHARPAGREWSAS